MTRRRALPHSVVALAVAVLVLDAALSPMNPSNFDATPIPGYEFNFGENPLASDMPWILSHLPANAQVLASNRLFPYVANNPNAWPIPWFVISPQHPAPDFPFSPSTPPQFVLVDGSDFGFVPAFLQPDLFNRSDYGLVAYVYATGFPETIYLFDRGYTLPAVSLEETTPRSYYSFSAANLTLGPAGAVQADPNSTYGQVIATAPGAGANASEVTLWTGPFSSFVPGNYTVSFSVQGSARAGLPPSTTVASLVGTWVGAQNVSRFFEIDLDVTDLSQGGWTAFQAPLNVSQPYPMVEFQGFLALESGRPVGSLELNYVSVMLDRS